MHLRNYASKCNINRFCLRYLISTSRGEYDLCAGHSYTDELSTYLDFPPLLDMSLTCDITILCETAFNISYMQTAACVTPIMASISTPVLWVVLTTQSIRRVLTLSLSISILMSTYSSGKGWQKGRMFDVFFAPITPNEQINQKEKESVKLAENKC